MDDLFAPPPPPDAGDGATPPPPPPPPPGEGVPSAQPTPPAYDPATPPTPPGAGPATQPEQTHYQPAFDPTAQTAQAKKGGGRKTLLIVVIGVILLCCCISVSGIVFAVQSGIFDEVAGGTLDEPGGVSSSDQGYVAEAGTVAVWLSWDTGADMDLEIWDSTGETYLTKSYAYVGDDITDGAMGDEYFEFASYSGQDFSSGEYVVSVYYFGGDGPPEVPVTVTVQDVEGRVQTFTKSVQYDPTYDQWHAFRIDASTGYVTTLDEWW